MNKLPPGWEAELRAHFEAAIEFPTKQDWNFMLDLFRKVAKTEYEKGVKAGKQQSYDIPL